MKRNKKILIILILVLTPLTIALTIGINAKFFHRDAVAGTEGSYEPKVYITPYGRCYHISTCSYVTNVEPIGIYAAQKRSYRACSRCKGIPSGTIWVEGIEPQKEQNCYITSFIISSFIFGVIGIILFDKLSNDSDL